MSIVPFRNLRERFNLKPRDKILDICGSGGQITEVEVDTLIDAVPPSYFEPVYRKTLPPDQLPPFDVKARNFIQLDVCRDRFPVVDKSFDFCICSHALEDFYDPRPALNEIARVAKRGLFIAPSRGLEMVFSHFDITNWLTGGVRIPGHSHHHWFFETKEEQLFITPKHYPLLYSKEFNFIRWNGPQENEYYWEGETKTRFFHSIDFQDLLADYRSFVRENQAYLKKGRVLYWADAPHMMMYAYWRRFRKIGNAYILGK